MKKLTSEQFLAIQNLTDNSMISHWAIDGHSSGLLRVTVISTEGASFDAVDALIEDVFPGKEYFGSPGESDEGDFYSINVEGETLINLMMKKSPVEVVWTYEDIIRQEA